MTDDPTHPDKYRDWDWDPAQVQAQMTYEAAVQLARIADALEERNVQEYDKQR
jgi:hypothetical protein